MMRAGAPSFVSARVKNLGDTVWPAVSAKGDTYQIYLGNHWLDAEGHPAIYDDARGAIPHDIMPGEEVDMPLVVHPPKQPGVYILELDMIQEGVAWFNVHGSEKVKAQIEAVGLGYSTPVTVEKEGAPA